MVKPIGTQGNSKMLKQTGAEIDTGGKMAKPLGGKMVKFANGESVKPNVRRGSENGETANAGGAIFIVLGGLPCSHRVRIPGHPVVRFFTVCLRHTLVSILPILPFCRFNYFSAC